MAFDIVKEFINAKTRFGDARGRSVPIGKLHEVTGQALIDPSKAVPNTTWGDVFLLGSAFLAYADPSTRTECIAQYRAEGKSKGDAGALCSFIGHPHADFVHTKSYKRAKKLFEKRQPLDILTKKHGGDIFAASIELTDKITRNEIFPFNEEFWGYGMRYAIARSAAGVVPTRFEIAIESIKEAIAELPETLRKAVSAVIPSLPSLSPIADIIKWGSIGGGLFLLYWYVLRPKKKPQATAK